MNLYYKIILIVFGLAYLISPFDIIPELFVPWIGWIDDSIVFATIFYMIRYGKLPNFIFKKKNQFPKSKSRSANSNNSFHSTRSTRQRSTRKNRANQSSDTGPSYRETQGSLHPKTPYEILGIKESATKKQIQTAYKEAIKKYHPDKLSHLGEEFSTLANEKFLEIQNAYDTLIKRY